MLMRHNGCVHNFLIEYRDSEYRGSITDVHHETSEVDDEIFIRIGSASSIVSGSGCGVTSGTRVGLSEWINGQPTTLQALQGKVVVLEMFRMVCPGCNSFSMPLISKWEKHYQTQIVEGKLIIVGIHTVFELHDYQSPANLKVLLKRKEIHHLVGIDRHNGNDDVPETMKAYRGRVTPEIIMIDKQGLIQFQKVGLFDFDKVERLIATLIEG